MPCDGYDVLTDLICVIDDLRGEINSNFGTREYNIAIQVLTYPNEMRDGIPSLTSNVQITPAPAVTFTLSNAYSMNSSGKYMEGELVLSLISLRYKESDLMPVLTKNQELLYVMTSIHGEMTKPRYFIPAETPRIDRHKTAGWIVALKERQVSNASINGLTYE